MTAKPVGQEQRHVAVYLIRHGQSRWNEAQKKRDVVGLVRRIDHQLTEAGVRQARALSTELASSSKAGEAAPLDRDGLAAVLAADAVWCSPLSRALQAALLGMGPVLSRKGPTPAPPLVLKPVLREKKIFGGLDTLGSRRGHGCVERAIASFGRAATPAEVCPFPDLTNLAYVLLACRLST